MAFLDNPQLKDIVNSTVAQVEKLEKSESVSLLKRFKEVRQELRDRLDIIEGDTFTAQQSRIVLVQIEAAISAMTRSLKEDIKPAGQAIAFRGAEDLVREIDQFTKIFGGTVTPFNINVARIANDTNNFLINRVDASLDAYGEDLRGLITANLSNLAILQVPFDTMLRKLSKFFIGEEFKLRRIARTELHNLYNLAKLKGMESTKTDFIPDLKKALFHPIDSRTGEDSIQLSIENPIIDIDKPFRFTFKKRLKDGSISEEFREFMAPPDRPNDRAVLIPFRPEWEE